MHSFLSFTSRKGGPFARPPARRFGLLLLFLAAWLPSHASPAQAAPASSQKPKAASAQRSAAPAPAIPATGKAFFDSVSIHKLYMDGDFEEAIALLEAAVREKPDFTHDDSVFLCKHLGVMYAATYETREKGKYYMRMLLMIEPTAKILDMYASDMIYMIFKNIQDELIQTRHRPGPTAAGSDTAGNAQPDPAPKSSKLRPWIWVGAGAALAAGAAAYFVLTAESGGDTDHEFSGR